MATMATARQPFAAKRSDRDDRASPAGGHDLNSDPKNYDYRKERHAAHVLLLVLGLRKAATLSGIGSHASDASVFVSRAGPVFAE